MTLLKQGNQDFRRGGPTPEGPSMATGLIILFSSSFLECKVLVVIHFAIYLKALIDIKHSACNYKINACLSVLKCHV